MRRLAPLLGLLAVTTACSPAPGDLSQCSVESVLREGSFDFPRPTATDRAASACAATPEACHPLCYRLARRNSPRRRVVVLTCERIAAALRVVYREYPRVCGAQPLPEDDVES